MFAPTTSSVIKKALKAGWLLVSALTLEINCIDYNPDWNKNNNPPPISTTPHTKTKIWQHTRHVKSILMNFAVVNLRHLETYRGDIWCKLRLWAGHVTCNYDRTSDSHGNQFNKTLPGTNRGVQFSDLNPIERSFECLRRFSWKAISSPLTALQKRAQENDPVFLPFCVIYYTSMRWWCST